MTYQHSLEDGVELHFLPANDDGSDTPPGPDVLAYVVGSTPKRYRYLGSAPRIPVGRVAILYAALAER